MRKEQLEFELPSELIAQFPVERGKARCLLVSKGNADVCEHLLVEDLPKTIQPSLWVFNDTRVIPARLLAKKSTGGNAEFLLLHPAPESADESSKSDPLNSARWTALAKGHKALRQGAVLTTEHLRITVTEKRDDGQVGVDLQPSGTLGLKESLLKDGSLPLPPYLKRSAEAADQQTYQTVFAKRDGSVAAPTAGLHFSEKILRELEDRGHKITFVTLHVGLGTFLPVRADDLSEHAMHEEQFELSDAASAALNAATESGTPIISVGTTSSRVLESAVQVGSDGRRSYPAGAGATSIFMYPPYQPRGFDALFTNFHLPGSTLVALVMSFLGIEQTRAAYQEAIKERYRFFSYGDSMFIGPHEIFRRQH